MRLTSRRTKSPLSFQYTLNSHRLSVLNSLKDLGVTYDSRLSFRPHINDIVAKASRQAKVILVCFTSRHPLFLLKAFTTFVRPLLEYLSIVWNPTSKEAIRNVESANESSAKISWFA